MRQQQSARASNATLIPNRVLRQMLGGVSHMWVYRREREDPDFPKPIRFGGPNGHKHYVLSEVEAYIEQRRAARG